MARSLLRSLLQRIRRSDRGAFLVEFAIVVPLLILLFGIVVEGGRLMWSYQTAAAGVRDAARYLGRIVPSDLCVTDTGNTSLGAYESSLRTASRRTSTAPA
jgi:Flp pilus assembly protein TadG